MYIGLGILLLVVGAILYFAVPDTSTPRHRPHDRSASSSWSPGALAIVLSFLATRRRPVGYTTTRESQVDPVSGSRVDRTDVDPR